MTYTRSLNNCKIDLKARFHKISPTRTKRTQARITVWKTICVDYIHNEQYMVFRNCYASFGSS